MGRLKMPRIFKFRIETDNPDDARRIRKLFDGTDSPMTSPYYFMPGVSNTHTRKVEPNRDWDYIEELNKEV